MKIGFYSFGLTPPRSLATLYPNPRSAAWCLP